MDAISAINFMKNYEPSCDLILIHINWGGLGAFYYIPKSVQTKIFRDIGREKYISLPKAGTNPRGAEISIMALNQLVAQNTVLKIPINWIKEDIKHNPLKRWVELWEKD